MLHDRITGGGQGRYAFQLLTGDLESIDTFNYWGSLVGPDAFLSQHYGYYESDFNIVALPNGNIISAGAYVLFQPNSISQRPSLLALHRPQDRFRIQKYHLLGAVDSTDGEHAGAEISDNLRYSTFDNRVYYADVTHHSGLFGGGCSIGDAKNYLHLVSLDTALNIRWRKFMPLGPATCSRIAHISPCDGRSGFIITGSTYNTARPLDTSSHRVFAYRIDSSGALSVIAGPTAPEIRDRLTLYPNPAREHFTLDDILGALSSLELYDARGTLVLRQSLAGRRATIPVSGLPPGLYLARVHTKDGETATLRVVKE